MMDQSRKNLILLPTLTITLLFLFASCSSTFQTRRTSTSGFLGDYSQLKKGGKDEAHLLYINPNADFSSYNSILMEPVKIYAKKDGDFAKMPEKDRKALVDYLDATVREHLKKNYTVVNEPGKGVMRLRIAITEATGSNVTLDTISSIIPIGMAIGLIKDIATGTNIFVGKASIEMELQDSLTGERLAAAVDERAGRKYTGRFDKFDKHHAVKDAFDYWAEKLDERLTALRQKQQ